MSEPVSSVEEVFCLESVHPQMGLGCRFRRAVVTAIMNLFLFFWSKWLLGLTAGMKPCDHTFLSHRKCLSEVK